MANTTIAPSAAALSLSIQKAALTLAGALIFGGVNVSMDLGISPLPGALSFAGSSPALALGTLAPAMGSLSFASDVPVMSLNITSGGAAALSVGGAAPTFGSGSAPDLLPGSMSIAGLAPQLAAGLLTPNSGTAALVGNVAALYVPNTTLQASAGVLALAGGLSGPAGSVIPVTGQGAISAVAPALNLTITLTVAGTMPLALGSYAPLVGLGLSPLAGLGMLTTVGILSPTLSASIATLSLTGSAPSLRYGSPLIAPDTGPAQITGIGVGVTLSVPAAPAANLVTGGLSPQILSQNFETPLAAGLQATGTTAILVQGTVPTTLTGVTQFSSSGPALAITLNGAAGVAVLSALPPVAGFGAVLAPSSSATLLVGGQPTFLPGVAFAPGSAALGLSGYAPAIFPASVVSTGAVALGSVGPTMNLSIQPVAAGLTFTGAAGTINGQAIIAIPGAVLGLTTGLPVQGYASNSVAGAVGLSGAGALVGSGLGAKVATLSIASDAPAVSLSGLALSLSGSLATMGASPALSLGIAPRTSPVQLASVLPGVNSLTTFFTLTGSFSLGSDGSTVIQPGVIPPPTGALALSSDQALMLRSGYAAPSAADLNFTTNVPRVIQTVAGYCIPATGGLSFVGQPAVNALYEPDAIHIVTLTGPYQYIVKLEG